MAIEIVDLLMKNGGSFHSKMKQFTRLGTSQEVFGAIGSHDHPEAKIEKRCFFQTTISVRVCLNVRIPFSSG